MTDNNITQKRIKLIFWLNIAFCTFSLLILLQLKGENFSESTDSSVIYERYAIMLTLIGIPVALKLFHSRFKKIVNQGTDKMKEYRSLSLLRILGLDILVLFNLVGFYIYHTTNFIYMSIIIIFALIFAFPSNSHLDEINESEKMKTDNTNTNNEEI